MIPLLALFLGEIRLNFSVWSAVKCQEQMVFYVFINFLGWVVVPVFPDVAVSNTFKELCNNYLEGGGGEKMTKWQQERGGLNVKLNTYRGALLFHSFLQTGKVVEELLEFKYKY